MTHDLEPRDPAKTAENDIDFLLKQATIALESAEATAAPAEPQVMSFALNDLAPPTRVRVLDTFKQITKSGGIHCFLPMKPSNDALAPAVIRAHYGDWSTHHQVHESSGWFLAMKP